MVEQWLQQAATATDLWWSVRPREDARTTVGCGRHGAAEAMAMAQAVVTLSVTEAGWPGDEIPWAAGLRMGWERRQWGGNGSATMKITKCGKAFFLNDR